MGADLLLACWWTTQPDQLVWADGIAAIAEVTLEEIEPESFAEIDENGLVETDPDEAFMERSVRPQLIKDLEEVKLYWEGQTDRATDRYTFGPVKALISGGTSWGDDPSEMWTVMVRIPDKVAEAVGFFV